MPPDSPGVVTRFAARSQRLVLAVPLLPHAGRFRHISASVELLCRQRRGGVVHPLPASTLCPLARNGVKFCIGDSVIFRARRIHLAQLPASPHVLELAQARALVLPQQGSQSLGEPFRYCFALVQMAGNLPLEVGNVLAVLGLAHGRPPNDLPGIGYGCRDYHFVAVADGGRASDMGCDIQSLRIPFPFLVSKSRGWPSWPMKPVRRFPR